MKHIKNIGTLLTKIAMISLLIIAFPSAQAAKGGGGKVSVTAAEPGEAVQGEELDVIVSGTGFDDGSTATFLVTRTSDDSQIEVLSNEYLPSTGQLKTRVKVKGSATVMDYDIQVTNSRGRRGKGTTLFRVKQIETACTGTEPKDPTIAYLTEFDTSGDINTADIYLSSASGCDQYLLVEDAFQVLPDSPQNEGVNRFIQAVRDLRFVVRGNRGVVTWHDTYQEPWVQMGLAFEFDLNGNIFPEAGSPWQMYFSPEGRDIVDADVRLTDLGETVLAMTEWSLDNSERLVSVYNVTTGGYEVVSSGSCQVQDESGDCFVPYLYSMRWNPAGNAIYFSPRNSFTDADTKVIARIRNVNEEWMLPELLMITASPDSALNFGTISPVGLMIISFETPITNKGGKHIGSRGFTGIIDLNLCTTSPCTTADENVFILPDGGFIWTVAGSGLFLDQGTLKEYSNPFTGDIGQLEIKNVARFDSSL